MQPNNQTVTHIGAANSQPHQHTNTLLRDSSKTIFDEVPPMVWLAFAWFLWAAFHWQSAVPAAIIGIVVWRVSEKQRVEREAAARVGACANISCPQVVFSFTPYESPASVSARAAQWREDLMLSGNIYWKEIPIIEFPFNPMIYGVGQLTYAWDIYRRNAGEKQHQENIKWVEGKCPKELRGAVLSQIIGQPEQTENQN